MARRILAILVVGFQASFSQARKIAKLKTNEVPCGSLSVDDSNGWIRLQVCDQERNPHFGMYHHEALALPALVAFAGTAKRALVLGGADGGVATQLLKSKSMEKVVLVTGLASLSRLSQKYLAPVSGCFRDARLEAVYQEPSKWLEDARDQNAEPFDIIVVERPWPGEMPMKWIPPFERIKALMAPKSLIVQWAATAWDMTQVKSMFDHVRQNFEHTRLLQVSTIEQFPWHEISFVAGSVDVLDVDWSWWEREEISTIFYHKALHHNLFVPAAITSRSLGLQLPPSPDIRAANEMNKTAAVFALPPTYDFETEEGGKQLIPSTKTAFQKLAMYEHSGYTALFLDSELQLTSAYGDFYHEGHVHPAMAALGPRGKRVLVIGGGDGGVTTLALKYPIEELIQVEIDEAVTNASRQFMPMFSQGWNDPRATLIIGDAVQWVKSADPSKKFDLCVIDTTDSPLKSIWSVEFYTNLKKLLNPHGAVLQNVGSMGDWLKEHLDFHQQVFKKVHVVNVNTPEYPSPYLLHMMTDELDPFTVDWKWWSSLELPTIYYQPSTHAGLFELPLETKRYYSEEALTRWDPYDAALLRKMAKAAKMKASSEL